MKRLLPSLNAQIVAERIQKLGIPLDKQQRIGTFAITWGMFESHLERAVWMLQGENVKGNRPSTDKTSANKWIEVLGEGSKDISNKGNEVLRMAAVAARDLMNYRHSLFHGYLVPLGGTAMFIRNPGWNGELRNREAGDAHIDDTIIDLAIEAAWTLFRLVMAVTKIPDKGDLSELEALESDIRHIKSTTNEVRHIAALMNHEKY